MTRRTFGASSFALMLAGSTSFAQQPAPVRVRGSARGDVVVELRFATEKDLRAALDRLGPLTG